MNEEEMKEQLIERWQRAAADISLHAFRDVGMECANCGLYCREQVEIRDENDDPIQSYCVCAYCGRPELRFCGRRKAA